MTPKLNGAFVTSLQKTISGGEDLQTYHDACLPRRAFSVALGRQGLENLGCADRLAKLGGVSNRVQILVLFEVLEAETLSQGGREIAQGLGPVVGFLLGGQGENAGHLVLSGGSKVTGQRVFGILVSGVALLQPCPQDAAPRSGGH